MQKLRILQIASGDLWAGAEVQLASLIRAMQDSSNVVQSAVLFNHGRLEDELLSIGSAVSVLNERELSPFAILTMIRRKIREIQPHVIHTHGYKENILGSFAARLANNVPCIRTVHGASEYSDYTLRRKILTGLDDIAAQYVQRAIVAVSTELCSQLRTKFGDKVIFIPNGIDDSVLTPENICSRANPLDDQPISVAFAGRLVPLKRVDLFIELARLATGKHPGRFIFHIFGDGPESARAAALIDKYGLHGMVNLHGFVSNFRQELARMDLLMITSDHEGLPMIVLEAIALNVPVIARCVGEIPSVLEGGKGGHLVDGDNPIDYALLLDKYLDNTGKFFQMATQARRHLQNNYTAKICAHRYISLYESLRESNIRVST